jgi:hypothetical protein
MQIQQTAGYSGFARLQLLELCAAAVYDMDWNKPSNL